MRLFNPLRSVNCWDNDHDPLATTTNEETFFPNLLKYFVHHMLLKFKKILKKYFSSRSLKFQDNVISSTHINIIHTHKYHPHT